MQNTGTLSPASAAKKPCNPANTHCKSSSLPPATYSCSRPTVVAGILLYRKSSVSTICSAVTPQASANSFCRPSLAAALPISGSISVCAFSFTPSLASLFMWIARFGIIIRSCSTLTRRASKRPSTLHSTRPATESGLSSQVFSSMPPYFSTFSFTYFLSTTISALFFSLNAGESQWQA